MAPVNIVNIGQDNLIAVSLCILCIGILRRRLRNQVRVRRRRWTRRWLLRRHTLSQYNTLVREMQTEDPHEYRNYFRMDRATFYQLLQKVTSLISRKNTKLRGSISAAERLAVTLRFLATGESYTSLQYQYRISKSTLTSVIPETCEAIYTVLKDEFLKVPNTEQDWRMIAEEFKTKWNFDHCIGAIDGKHILIKPPAKSGSLYYNYKHTFSIVLLALVDADYKFTYVDIGCNGRVSDGGVFKNSTLGHALEQNSLHIPSVSPLPGRENPTPYVIVGDDAFPLKSYLMKPYNNKDFNLEKRIFDYRLSRARRIVENAFGILANRFRVFMTPISLAPEKVEIITLAAVCLHNMLREQQSAQYTPPGSIDYEDHANYKVIPGEWRSEVRENLTPITQQGSNRYSLDAKSVRDEFMTYFNTNGEVEWQWSMI